MGRTKKVEPKFTEAELGVLFVAARNVFDMFGNELFDGVSQMTRNEVIEVVSDANHLETELNSMMKRDAARGSTSVITDDMIARVTKISYDGMLVVLKPAFPFATYS